MVSEPKNETEMQVQDRILDSAERLFCEKGYAETSIRDITSQANCNVAAVNYHFGSKDNLYYKVFQRYLSTLRDVRLESINRVMSQEDVSLERLLHAFAVSFIEPLLDKDRSRIFMRLMVREMLDPHLPKRLFADEMAAPTMKSFGRALMKLCPRLDDRDALMSMLSVIGQLIHIVHLENIFDDKMIEGLEMPDLNEMVEHIVRFSAAGITELCEKQDKQANNKT
jgi:AcrR family transcriptional regulator